MAAILPLAVPDVDETDNALPVVNALAVMAKAVPDITELPAILVTVPEVMPAPVTLKAPATVLVNPLLPIVIELAIAVPTENEPVVVDDEPLSMDTFPELPPVALPDVSVIEPLTPAVDVPVCMLTPLLVVPAAVWIVPFAS